jgi:isopentenyldiphosphate isomerase
LSYPPIQIVDEYDNPIGGASIKEAREKGLYHRIVRIMVEDEQGRVLLQMRSSTVRAYPSCWDNSAAGHVDEGETYDQAAYRELSEEIGLNNTILEEIGTYTSSQEDGDKQTNRFNKVYKAAVEDGTDFVLQEEEVAEVRWFTIADVRAMIQGSPELVTDGLVDVFARYYS